MKTRSDERRYQCRRWIWRHPLRTVYRAWTWLRWKGIPPWRMGAVQLVWIDPRPLSPKALAAMRALLVEQPVTGGARKAADASRRPTTGGAGEPTTRVELGPPLCGPDMPQAAWADEVDAIANDLELKVGSAETRVVCKRESPPARAASNDPGPDSDRPRNDARPGTQDGA